jgi:hypothetical protein
VIPEASRSRFRKETDQASERSDAGSSILPKLIGIVKPESVRSEAKVGQRYRRKGCGERGGSPCPRLNTQRPRSANSAPALLATRDSPELAPDLGT